MLRGSTLYIMVVWLGGCSMFEETSFPLSPRDVLHVSRDASPLAQRSSRDVADTRTWLRDTMPRLERLMPSSYGPTLVTEQLVEAGGRPVDLYRHFGYTPQTLVRLLDNFSGMRCSALCGSGRASIDTPAAVWPGFEDVWIPVAQDLSLGGRLGLATDAGRAREADCIIILPGLFGDVGVLRSRDLAIGLRECGFHVLALEPRGHGQTEARYPGKHYLFGVAETDELCRVNDWLERRPFIRGVGLIGYCWNANAVLLGAWYDSRRPDDPAVAAPRRNSPFITPPRERPRFAAGVMAFSTVVRWEELVEALDPPYPIVHMPHLHTVQGTVRSRMERKRYADSDGSLRRLICAEYARIGFELPGGMGQGYRFLRLVDHCGQPAGDKLESCRVPVLLVHGANDPLTPAQEVADLMAGVRNPLVAATVLPDGGHVGFAAHAKEHYFSLIVNFFDPLHGAAAMSRAKPQSDH